MAGGVRQAASPEEAAFRRVAAQLYRYDDCISECQCREDRGLRGIVVTRIMAQYEAMSHLVISINGSPPRGTFIICPRYNDGAVVYFTETGRPKRIEPWRSERQREQHRVIIAYMRTLAEYPSDN